MTNADRELRKRYRAEAKMRRDTIKANRCCKAWAKALTEETDDEGWLSLVKCEDGEFVAGMDMPPWKFCPWCGKAKVKLA